MAWTSFGVSNVCEALKTQKNPRHAPCPQKIEPDSRGSSPAMTDVPRCTPSPQIQFLEEIIALVVDDDEGRKIHDLDAPDRFHTRLGIFHDFDLLDAVLGEVRRRSSDRAEIEAAVLLAGFAHGDRAVAFCEHHHRS